MVELSNTMCKVDYESLIAIVFIVFSLLNIYWPLELKQSKKVLILEICSYLVEVRHLSKIGKISMILSFPKEEKISKMFPPHKR